MSYLANLKVNKVSFVGSPANKRKWLLLKSADSQQQQQQAVQQITEEVKKVADEKKVQEPEVAVVEKQHAEEIAALRKQLADRDVTIDKIIKDQRRRDLISILNVEAPFSPIAVEKAVEHIMQLETVNADAAKVYIDNLKSASVAIKESKLFSEVGTTRDANRDSIATDYVAKISASLQELKKSGDASVKPSDVVINVIKELGDSRFEEYRREHVRRAHNSPSV